MQAGIRHLSGRYDQPVLTPYDGMRLQQPDGQLLCLSEARCPDKRVGVVERITLLLDRGILYQPAVPPALWYQLRMCPCA